MNSLRGIIVSIQHDRAISLVEFEVAGVRMSATLLETPNSMPSLNVGAAVNAQFKETEVALSKGQGSVFSIRNRLPVKITAIARGEILTAVSLDFLGHSLTSVITTKSAEMMSLSVGDALEALIKSNEVSFMQEAQ